MIYVIFPIVISRMQIIFELIPSIATISNGELTTASQGIKSRRDPSDIVQELQCYGHMFEVLVLSWFKEIIIIPLYDGGGRKACKPQCTDQES